MICTEQIAGKLNPDGQRMKASGSWTPEWRFVSYVIYIYIPPTLNTHMLKGIS